MAEAEGLLLDLAWHGVEPLARRLRARRARAESPYLELAALRTELHVFLSALFARRFEIVPLDAVRASFWRAPWRRAPWSVDLEPLPATDGRAIYLPRALRALDAGAARVAALGLAARIVHGSVAELPRDPLARDLFWLIDGARIDRWLGAELPGLARSLRAARSSELAGRRAW